MKKPKLIFWSKTVRTIPARNDETLSYDFDLALEPQGSPMVVELVGIGPGLEDRYEIPNRGAKLVLALETVGPMRTVERELTKLKRGP